MSQNKQDKIQKQKKVQDLYRKIKRQRKEDIDDKADNKIVIAIVNICAVLGFLVLLLNVFIKDF